MSEYTVSGYLVLLEERDQKTILVEGVDDQRAICRVLNGYAEAALISRGDFLVDTAQIINPEGVVAGNRAIVEHVYAAAASRGVVLACLVDREFREFQTTGEIADNLNSHRVVPDSLFWTRGHSLENYFFDVEYCLDYLRAVHPVGVQPECYSVLEEQFATILQWCASVSLALNDHGMLSRSLGLARTGFWKVNEHTPIAFDVDKFSEELDLRGNGPPIANAISRSIHLYFTTLSRSDDPAIYRWISHGHLGWELIWSAVGACVLSCGVQKGIVQTIGQGDKTVKVIRAQDLWTLKVLNGSIDSPYGLWDWCVSSV